MDLTSYTWKIINCSEGHMNFKQISRLSRVNN